MNRYYTPELEEFHLGFECEIRNGADAQGKFNEYKLDTFFIKDIMFKIKPNSVRVRYLNRKDLEELGFKITAEETKPYGQYYRGILKHKNGRSTELWYSFLTNSEYVYVSLKTSHYNGNCRVIIKNKSELKRILKQNKIR